MRSLVHVTRSVVSGCAIVVGLGIALYACASKCGLGEAVVIPTSDNSNPEIRLGFFLPDGGTPTATATNAIPDVVVRSGETVNLLAVGKDSEGIRDVQIRIEELVCSGSGEQVSCSPPGLTEPVSNPVAGKPGDSTCTERLAQANLVPTRQPSGSRSFNVSAKAINFGGKTVATQVVRVTAR